MGNIYRPPFGLRGHALNLLQNSLVAAPAFTLYGYNQANVGGLIKLQDWSETFPEIDTIHAHGSSQASKSTLQGFTVATFVIGAIIGAVSCAWIGDILGRRKGVFVAAALTLIGVALEASSFYYAQLVVGRITIGLGAGMVTSLIPVWQSETSSSHNRGRQVILDGIFLAFGYVLESWINLGFYEFKTGPVTWRPPIAVGGIMSIVLLVSIHIFPESPRWLIMKDRCDEARAIIGIIRDLPEDDIEVEAEMASVRIVLEQSKASEVKLTHVFRNGPDKLFYRFALCMLLQFYPQMAGSNLISVYASILFQENLGMSPKLSKILSGATLTWKFFSCFLAFYTIDRLGRRFAFMLSGGGMAACMIAMAVATSYPPENQGAQIAAAFSIFLFNFFVPIGFLGANFLYCSEVAPLRLRMAMASISTANHWLWNFVVTMITPVALKTLGFKYYIVFASIGITIPVAVFFLFPETMGRNLEDIDLLFRESPTVWVTVRESKKRSIGMASEHLGKDSLKRIENAETASLGSR